MKISIFLNLCRTYRLPGITPLVIVITIALGCQSKLSVDTIASSRVQEYKTIDSKEDQVFEFMDGTIRVPKNTIPEEYIAIVNSVNKSELGDNLTENNQFISGVGFSLFNVDQSPLVDDIQVNSIEAKFSLDLNSLSIESGNIAVAEISGEDTIVYVKEDFIKVEFTENQLHLSVFTKSPSFRFVVLQKPIGDLRLDLNEYSFDLDKEIEPILPTADYGKGPWEFTVSPDLPNGLSLNSETGEISGTPIVISALQEYAISAKHVLGVWQKTLSISVTTPADPDPPASDWWEGVAYSGTEYKFQVGTQISSLQPSVIDERLSYSINPELPSGLSFDVNTGTISGTPTAASANTEYTITISDSYVTLTKQLSIAIGHVPTAISYGSESYFFEKDELISPLSPGANLADTSYILVGTLPAGLSIDVSTGEISGTPDTAVLEHEVTVRVYNDFGTSETTLAITVGDEPESLAFPLLSLKPEVGKAMGAAVPTFTGDHLEFSVSPALPAGLSLNATNGHIIGTPDSITAWQVYTVTATNALGSVEAKLSLEVVAAIDLGAVCTGFPMTASTAAQLDIAIRCFYQETVAGNYEVTLTGDLSLSEPVLSIVHQDENLVFVVNGDGNTIDGQNTAGLRIFDIADSTSVKLTSLSLVNADSENKGGAVFNRGDLTVEKCTFEDNVANYGAGVFNTGEVSITNSTFSGNSADNSGASLYSSGVATVLNATLISTSENASKGNIVNHGQLTMTNSIVKDSAGGDCIDDLDSSTTITYTLLTSNTANCGQTNGVDGNIVGVDPDLASLQVNGGQTKTFLPNSGSPVLDAGLNGSCPADDQNGTARPQGADCDMGASELQSLGQASAFGTVALQGRVSPGSTGTVTLIDNTGTVPDVVVNFDAGTGAFTFTNFPVPPSPDFKVVASHELYLDGEISSITINDGDNTYLGSTSLRGGDANNDGTIDSDDMDCIGAYFNAGVGTCPGGVGSTDINNDGITNIQDLSVTGGNSGKTSPQPW